MPPLQDNETALWFEREVHPHEPELRRYLLGLTARDNIDDLVQETYIRLLQTRLKEKIRVPRGFLFSIARNAARDVSRRERTAKTNGVADLERLDVVDHGKGTHEIVCIRQETEILQAAIAELPERCRTVLILRKLHNLSQKEIAARMGISVNTVEGQLTKAFHRCCKYFRTHGAMPGKRNQ